jgi:hypothetical protein
MAEHTIQSFGCDGAVIYRGNMWGLIIPRQQKCGNCGNCGATVTLTLTVVPPQDHPQETRRG